MIKWIETSKTQVRIPYLLLVSIDVPTFGVGMHEKIPLSKIKEIANLMKALRYFEVSSKESADEVFLEAARIYIRETQSNPSLATISLLQQACVRNGNHLDLKKRGITLLPSLIYYLSSTVKIVELDHNNLKNFPLEFVYFDQLQELTLSNNQIEEIPLEVSKMSSLVLLNLSNNLIDDIPISSVIISTIIIIIAIMHIIKHISIITIITTIIIIIIIIRNHDHHYHHIIAINCRLS
jgi:Leucine-rich repeat (LRR) protein